MKSRTEPEALCKSKQIPRWRYIEMANIVNDYNNTEELMQRFPVEHPTFVADGIGKDIQNRLLTGFENWNRGFDAWKEWGNILYTQDSIYNVHGARMTLAEYQAAMDITLKQVNIQMGAFHDMIICDDWTAIRYDITTFAGGREIPGSVMEFVNFRDYGFPLRTRVVEGWGAPKDSGYQGMSMFQSEEGKRIQKEQFDAVLKYEIPASDDLSVKYPIMHPTTDHSDWASEIRLAILENFEAWNQGYEVWASWTDRYCDAAAACTNAQDQTLSLSDYKAAMKEQMQAQQTKRLYFDNMLISGEWAAIHYRTVSVNPETGEREAGDRMQFLHFTMAADGVKMTACWTK